MNSPAYWMGNKQQRTRVKLLLNYYSHYYSQLASWAIAAYLDINFTIFSSWF